MGSLISLKAIFIPSVLSCLSRIEDSFPSNKSSNSPENQTKEVVRYGRRPELSMCWHTKPCDYFEQFSQEFCSFDI